MKFTKLAKFSLFLLTLAVVIIGLLRFTNLSADPVNISILHNEDEGNYSYNARNLTLNNKLIVDGVNFFFVSPLWTILQYPFVKVVGVTFSAFRLPAALSSIILIIAIIFFVKKVTNKVIFGLIAGLLTASNFLLLIHSRIAMPETTVVLLSTLGLMAWYQTLKKYPQINLKWSLTTGIFWSLGYLAKGNGIYLGITMFLAVFLIMLIKRQLPSIKELPKLFCPFLIFAVVYFTTTIIFKTTFPFESSVASLELTDKYRPLLRSQVLNPAFWLASLSGTLQGGEATVWRLLPFLAIGSLLFMVGTIVKIVRRQADVLDASILAFLVGSLFWFNLITYKPARYFLLVVPALIVSNVLLIRNQGLVKYLGLILIIATLFLDCVLGIKYVYTHQTFEDVQVASKLGMVLNSELSTGKSEGVWMLDNPYPVENIYFLGQTDVTSQEKAVAIINYFNRYRWPSYIVTKTTSLPDWINKLTTKKSVLKTRLNLVINHHLETLLIFNFSNGSPAKGALIQT
ncbi:MAG: glycosyltransferase family 39 protein [candidate division WWE3 bacterium]|nr:glycosyltransferase family 39 protein [candidate division WWE3 bacterium]